MEEEKLERLPDSELTVMKAIWNAKKPVGTGYLVTELSKEKNWSRSTIQVLLTRLKEKGFLECKKNGRVMSFTPLIKEEFYCAHETKNFLDQFYNSSYKNLIATLVQEQTIKEEDLEEIISIIKNGGE